MASLASLNLLLYYFIHRKSVYCAYNLQSHKLITEIYKKTMNWNWWNSKETLLMCSNDSSTQYRQILYKLITVLKETWRFLAPGISIPEVDTQHNPQLFSLLDTIKWKNLFIVLTSHSSANKTITMRWRKSMFKNILLRLHKSSVVSML